MKSLLILTIVAAAALALPEPPAPGNSYLPPSSSYGAPSSQYSAPTGFGGGARNGGGGYRNGNGGGRAKAPSSSYGAPSAQYGAPGGGYAGGNGGDQYAEPASYQFEYEVNDPESGNNFGHKEQREGERAQGEYHVLLPDGRTQIVTYTADERGYMPEVRYEGGNGGAGGYGRGPAGGRRNNGY